MLQVDERNQSWGFKTPSFETVGVILAPLMLGTGTGRNIPLVREHEVRDLAAATVCLAVDKPHVDLGKRAGFLGRHHVIDGPLVLVDYGAASSGVDAGNLQVLNPVMRPIPNRKSRFHHATEAFLRPGVVEREGVLNLLLRRLRPRTIHARAAAIAQGGNQQPSNYSEHEEAKDDGTAHRKATGLCLPAKRTSLRFGADFLTAFTTGFKGHCASDESSAGPSRISAMDAPESNNRVGNPRGGVT